ncbi:nucleotidyltransferase domain-containing protein [Clostridium taeniosporum]|uniref:Nucleotidyltransferase domain-containing protein n=1 Tax=Clostridium taeniosporum TaxID=394958 RepID=A0A1D7XN19_9CLOT|nr:nucleotidyltransferase domain-containing protein [Clostridium taeniosporum]AOR24580.1 nucleotidyltransferase domain-containing protein [Clostridium taeniosporum]
MYGLLDKDLEYILKGLSKFLQIEKALIFGSRAIGNYKKGSDIDLTIVGSEINDNILRELYDYLNEVCPIPYFFDLLHYENISNEKLKKHIDDYGKIIYNR